MMRNTEVLYAKAVKFHRAGRLPEAIKLYSDILRLNQDDAKVLYLLGSAHLQIAIIATEVVESGALDSRMKMSSRTRLTRAVPATAAHLS